MDIYAKLLSSGLTETAACAMLGNWFCESGLRSNNAEDCFYFTDKEYTETVDKGELSKADFVSDDVGYGLAQWSFGSRKEELYDMAKAKGVSIADEAMQVEFAIKELKRDFYSLYKYLCRTNDLEEATSRICYEYEKPAIKNVSERYEMAQQYYREKATDMDVVEKYVQEAMAIANDNSHGYSQTNRNGNPDYDCSSLVNTVVQNAGIPVKSKGATYTGNMYQAYLACGFKDVIREVDVYSGRGLLRGDILLNKANHTAIYMGNGQIVHARSNDGHPEPGDQSSREIVAGQSYYNYPWDAILRYQKGEPIVLANENIDEISVDKKNNKYYPEIIKMGDKGEEVRKLQEKLIVLGYNCGVYGADGEFGADTFAAVKAFQTDRGLLVDGEAGPETFGALNTAPAKTGNIKLGDTVKFKGGFRYITSSTTIGSETKAGEATVTAIKEGAKHPYHIIKAKGSLSNVYGWVDADRVEK